MTTEPVHCEIQVPPDGLGPRRRPGICEVCCEPAQYAVKLVCDDGTETVLCRPCAGDDDTLPEGAILVDPGDVDGG